MLVIRQSQLHIFEVDARERFEQKLVRHFLKTYPRECRQAGSVTQIEKLVADGVKRAMAMGFESDAQVSLFVALCFILGHSFDRDPQIPWAGKMLGDTQAIRNPALRMNAVYDRMLDYLGATAGERCELVVRAMIRLRDWDMAAGSPALGPRWDAEMLALLRKLYPQKFDYQGEEANRYLLADSEGKCELVYGIRSAQGKALFTILMFMLGSGFDVDHLHPWATRILTDARMADEGSRVAALYEAAMGHLRESLQGDGHHEDEGGDEEAQPA